MTKVIQGEKDIKLVDVLTKYPQYESFPYTRDLECPNCSKSGFNPIGDFENANLIGWCETNIGYMGIFECIVCGQKFRFHCTIGTWTADIDEFDFYLYFYAEKCANFDEIKKTIMRIESWQS